MTRKNYEHEVKLQMERKKYRRACSCGHTIIVLPTGRNHRDYVICDWCHKKVFRDDEKQKIQDEKVKREAFRMKIRSLI